ncbi:hypothetical protein QR98_0081960, partial [Sarcoptes scabiei]
MAFIPIDVRDYARIKPIQTILDASLTTTTASPIDIKVKPIASLNSYSEQFRANNNDEKNFQHSTMISSSSFKPTIPIVVKTKPLLPNLTEAFDKKFNLIDDFYRKRNKFISANNYHQQRYQTKQPIDSSLIDSLQSQKTKSQSLITTPMPEVFVTIENQFYLI